jgi:hypothetical protein
MRRIFTSTFVAAVLVATSFNSFAQCNTGVAFTHAVTYDFSAGMQGFASTDFAPAANKIVSTDLSFGSAKLLNTPTFFQPVSQTTISWGFDLAGSASVTGYTVDAIYSGGIVNVCSGGAIGGNNLGFSASAPAQILGQSFQLKFTFTVSGNPSQNITIDNFSTSAQTSNITLPVKFSAFDARTMNGSVSLNWTVGTEENVSGYEIERSFDGNSFSKIGFVNASGESTYSFLDTKPSSITYYRIKSLDVNGRYNYSTIALVKAGASIIVLKAFPSPFIKNVSIQHATATAGSIISVSSEDGRIVKSIIPAIGTQQTEVDLSFAKAGMYLVRYISGTGEVGTLKILKQQ